MNHSHSGREHTDRHFPLPRTGLLGLGGSSWCYEESAMLGVARDVKYLPFAADLDGFTAGLVADAVSSGDGDVGLVFTALDSHCSELEAATEAGSA